MENPAMENIEKLREKVAKDPSSKLFVPLAEEYRKAGRLDEAIEALKAGLERQPGYMSARVALGKMYIEKNMLPEAREELEKVVKSIPDNLFAQRKLADIYKQIGDIQKAVAQYKTVLKLNPLDDEALSILKGLEAGGLPEPEAVSTESALETTAFADEEVPASEMPELAVEATAFEEAMPLEAAESLPLEEGMAAPSGEDAISDWEIPDEGQAAFPEAEALPPSLKESMALPEGLAEELTASVEPEEEHGVFTIEAPEAITTEDISFEAIPEEEDAAYTLEPEDEGLKPFTEGLEPLTKGVPEELLQGFETPIEGGGGADDLSAFGVGFAYNEAEPEEKTESAYGQADAFEIPAETRPEIEGGFELSAGELASSFEEQTSLVEESVRPEKTIAAPAMTALSEGVALSDSQVGRGDYAGALKTLGALSRENPNDKTVIQRMHELKALLKLLGKDKEIIIARLEAFLEGIRRERNEFFGNS